jgi:hypothetical protein
LNFEPEEYHGQDHGIKHDLTGAAFRKSGVRIKPEIKRKPRIFSGAY